MRILLLCLFSITAWAQGHGISSYPLRLKEHYVSVELSGIFSDGSGLQARYSGRLNSDWTLGWGFGFSGGAKANYVFVNADYEIYPDIELQPRFSVKTALERSYEYGQNHIKVGGTPLFSKGFYFWGREGFPFVGFPLALDLNTDNQTYALTSQVAFGFSMPVQKKLFANFEMNMNVQNSYSGMFLGFSYPLN